MKIVYGLLSNNSIFITDMTKKASIKVKTPVGISDEETVEDIIMQGETLSSILCTSTVGQIEKECNLDTFKYREEVEVPKMSFVDDILDVTECGKDTVEMNEYTRTKINERKLQLNAEKCVKMHIDKRTDHTCNDELKIDVWEVKKEEKESNIILKDEYKGETNIKTVTKHLYLGDTVASNGTNKFTIEDRIGKSEGITRDILHILEDTFFGEYYIEPLASEKHQ